MKELETTIIDLDNISLLAKLITDSDLTYEELQTACFLLRDIAEEKIDAVRNAFYR